MRHQPKANHPHASGCPHLPLKLLKRRVKDNEPVARYRWSPSQLGGCGRTRHFSGVRNTRQLRTQRLFRNPMYPPCTSLWRIRWFCRFSRLLKSISCALSIRLRIPTPPASTNCTRAKGVAARTRGKVRRNQSPNLAAPRAFAFSASSSRFFGGAFVSSECKKLLATL